MFQGRISHLASMISYHPVELWCNYVVQQKMDYTHNTPVEAGWLTKILNICR